jgi:hypothetical protein
MMPADPTTLIAALRVERTYSPHEAAALLGRSYSWLDQRVRNDEFVLPDGTVVRPFRTPGGYRRFTLAMLKDIAICSRNHHWFSWEKLQTTLLDLAMASYRETEEGPSPANGWSLSGRTCTTATP